MTVPVKRLAIMQPYFLPYIGYFQLMAAVDKFVLFDDVTYIKRGWINRNRLSVNGDVRMFTIPLQQASQNKLISQINIVEDRKWREKFLRTINQSYKKTSNFEVVYNMLEDIVNFDDVRLSNYILNSIITINQYLGIEASIVTSSEVYNNSHLKGQLRILDICYQENAKIYINPEGGAEIYDKYHFRECGVSLQFLKSDPIRYSQRTNPQVHWLSMIDVLMFNKKDIIKKFLSQYKLH